MLFLVYLQAGAADSKPHFDERISLARSDVLHAKKNVLEHLSTIGSTHITITIDDIIKQNVDALVNAANPDICFGSGWAGITKAISDAVGSDNLHQLDDAVEDAKRRQLGAIRSLNAGEAIISAGFGELHDKKIVHALAPDLRVNSKDPQVLKRTYTNTLYRADEANIISLALPLLGAGVYGWPAHESAKIAAYAVKEFLQQNPHTSLQEIRFVIYDHKQYCQAKQALSSVFDE